MAKDVTVKATPQASKILKTFLVNTTWKTSQEIAAEAKSLCPVDTGRLQRSIKVVKEDEGIYKIGSQLDYAIFIEMGTRYISAVGFLRRAFWNVLRNKL
jgi:hypothetical protein